MLTASQAATRRRRPPVSPRQQYQQWLLDRIEDYKEQIPRDELLQLGDEAAAELSGGADGQQYLLTEVLMADTVDRLIAKRLRLKSFSRWRQQFLKLREAQRAPTHWGLEADTPLAELATTLGDGDLAVVIGAGATTAALYLAALDATVLFVDRDLAAVEAAESRAAAEAIGSRFQAFVVNPAGGWFPDVSPWLVVIDPAAMAAVPVGEREELLAVLKHRTRDGGMHCVLPAEPRADVIPLAPEAMQAHYAGWRVKRGRRSNPRARWFLATKP